MINCKIIILQNISLCEVEQRTFDIKKELKLKGMSVQELADRLGISRVTLSTHINGKPTIKMLERIAEAIGCQVKDFFTPDQPEQKQNVQ